MRALVDDDDAAFPSTPGKTKIIERGPHHHNRHRHRHHLLLFPRRLLWSPLFLALLASYLSLRSFLHTSSRYLSSSFATLNFDNRVRASTEPTRPDGLVVLVTGATGFVGSHASHASHASLALARRGDGIVGLDNFNSY